ncbi:oxidoreductase [Ascodesmis nigricans]|uniref:Oxidoreductase n=1 Tax=Ascodesmis nigricans TaxID=341454 RepID=A0A4S2N404_9PEZI|nr:oxidoreductase [Ascodesmis nigricans]
MHLSHDPEPISSSVNPSLSSTKPNRPNVGLGLYLSPPAVTKRTVLWALEIGYRHFDTAQYYENESQLGEAIRESGIPREQVFLCTKILFPEGSMEGSLEKCKKSLKDMGVDYVDLFLIHSPTSGPNGRRELWEALCRLKEEGGARQIGVSNYGVKHIEEIKTFSNVMPAVNQVEIHPWCQQRPIIEHCKANHITIQAYSPLVRNTKADHPVLRQIAETLGTSTTKVLLQWSLNQGYLPLPKSDDLGRLKENFDVRGFVLCAGDMKRLNDLDEGMEGAVVPQYTEAP